MLESLNCKVEIEGLRVVLRPKSWSQNIGRVRRLLVAGNRPTAERAGVGIQADPGPLKKKSCEETNPAGRS